MLLLLFFTLLPRPPANRTSATPLHSHLYGFSNTAHLATTRLDAKVRHKQEARCGSADSSYIIVASWIHGATIRLSKLCLAIEGHACSYYPVCLLPYMAVAVNPDSEAQTASRYMKADIWATAHSSFLVSKLAFFSLNPRCATCAYAQEQPFGRCLCMPVCSIFIKRKRLHRAEIGCIARRVLKGLPGLSQFFAGFDIDDILQQEGRDAIRPCKLFRFTSMTASRLLSHVRIRRLNATQCKAVQGSRAFPNLLSMPSAGINATVRRMGNLCIRTLNGIVRRYYRYQDRNKGRHEEIARNSGGKGHSPSGPRPGDAASPLLHLLHDCRTVAYRWPHPSCECHGSHGLAGRSLGPRWHKDR